MTDPKNAERERQLKKIDEMRREITNASGVRPAWEKLKKAVAPSIDVKVFDKNLGPALDKYRAMLKGGYDVMVMHGALEAKSLAPVKAAKAKVDAALEAYLRLAAQRQKNPADRLTDPKNARTAPAKQKEAWAAVERELRKLRSYTDDWYKNLELTQLQQRKLAQGEYRRG